MVKNAGRSLCTFIEISFLAMDSCSTRLAFDVLVSSSSASNNRILAVLSADWAVDLALFAQILS